MADFQPAVSFVLKHEDSHPSGKITYDAGGLTKYGIASVYNPDVDVANLSLDSAEEIYFCKYWTPFHLSGLTSQPVASKILDCLVNPGMGFAKIIQFIAGVPQDGAIGPLTIGKLNLMEPDALLDGICAAQAEYYREHDSTKPYLDGLLARAADRPEGA